MKKTCFKQKAYKLVSNDDFKGKNHLTFGPRLEKMSSTSKSLIWLLLLSFHSTNIDVNAPFI